jgi:type IV secretory pathway VirD2 relaxase
MAERKSPFHSDDALLDPRLGGRATPRADRMPRLRSAVLQRLQSTRGSGLQRGRSGPPASRGGHPRRGVAACDVREPPSTARRATVKAHVHRMTAPGAQRRAHLHLRYIQREGVERDGSSGVLYDADGVADSAAFAEPLPGEAHQFRLIVAPEDAAQLDLTDYVRRLVGQIEADTGRSIIWCATNHYNTAHPHAHLLIRGLDRDGKELRLDGRYIANGMRWRAQELATAELGERTPAEIRRQLDAEVTKQRLTSIDRHLAALLHDGTIRVDALPSGPADAVRTARLIARLSTLQSLGLVSRISPRSWRPADGWLDRLRAMGQRDDIIKTMHQALGVGAIDPSRCHVLPDPDARLPPSGIQGILRRVGLHDELAGSMYAVVETASGDAYYLPRDRSEDIPEGSVVRLTEHKGRFQLVHRPTLQEQVRYKGPTWLDVALVDGSVALYGFGADVRRARAQRDDFVRSVGIDPASPSRQTLLRSLERQELGAQLASQHKATFVPGLQPGSAFTGKVVALPALPNGQRFVLCLDEPRRRFVLVPLTRELGALDGQKVTLTRGTDGRLQTSRSRAPERT